MSWRRKKDDEYEKWKEMFPWLPFDLFENSGFFNDEFIAQLMEEVNKMMEHYDASDPEAFRKKMGPLTWGWNMSIGPDGKPVFKEFGNVKPSTKGSPIASKDREPLVDIFIEDKVVRAIVELPGVAKDEINVKTTDSKIIITTVGTERNYSCERELSVKINPKTAFAKYRNGILELTVDRKEPAKVEPGFEVKIE